MVSCFFVIFEKVEKNIKFWELILDPFSISGAPTTPTFRATAIAGLPADTLTQWDNIKKGDVR